VNRFPNATEAEKSKLPILVPHMDFETARIGNGALVCSGVIGTVNIVLDAFALCNFGCTLGHEVRIGKGSVVNSGANISGRREGWEWCAHRNRRASSHEQLTWFALPSTSGEETKPEGSG
jgi:hypothetical protein